MMERIAMVDRQGEGEARLRARRRGLWWITGSAVAIGVVLAFVIRAVRDLSDRGAIDPLLLWPLLAVMVAGMTYFCWLWFRRIDEVDLLDNLWAGLIGFYFYFIATPCWWTLAQYRQAPAYDAMAMWLATTIIMFGAYLWRKARHLL